MRYTATPSGFTKVELLIVLTIIAVLLAIVIVGVDRTLADARSLVDSRQISTIHKGWLILAQEIGAVAPLPSLVARNDSSSLEDFSLNHSANIYSLMTAWELFPPRNFISPLEVSDHVTQADYNYEAYDPTNVVYWDPSFVMHIEDPSIGANSSYAHIAAVGDRRDALGLAQSRNMPILGTRGSDVTNLDPAEYQRSPTYRFSKPYDRWSGNIVFTDNHVETLQTFYPQLTAYRSPSRDRAVKDNIFSADFDHPNGPQAAADAFLGIYTGATQFTVDDVYDPLLDD